MATNENMHFAKKVRLEQLVSSKGPAVEVTTHTTVEEVAKILKKKNNLGLPVWDEETLQYIGFVDVLDLLAHTALFCDVLQHHTYRLEDLEETASFGYGTVMDLIQDEDRKIHVFGPHGTLENLMKLLDTEEIQRVLVKVQVRGNVWSGLRRFWWREEHRMLTLTDVVRYLAKQKRVLEDLKAIKVSEIPGVIHPVSKITLAKHKNAMDGFLLMKQQKSDCVIIVDRANVAVATLTASDLRGISRNLLRLLLLPVQEYIATMTGKRQYLLVCSADDSASFVLKKLATTEVHRIWVVDSAGKPIGLVTQQAIVRLALHLSVGGVKK